MKQYGGGVQNDLTEGHYSCVLIGQGTTFVLLSDGTTIGSAGIW